MKIGEVHRSMTATFTEWSPHLLLNQRYIRRDETISWDNYETEMLEQHITTIKVAELADKGQYSFQLIDGSLVQIYYSYDAKGKEVIAARLAFYSSIPYGVADYVNWLRIDYDPKANNKGVLHHDCHIHFSSFPNSRFIVAGLPTPRQFIEFIAAYFYPEIYKTRRLNKTGQYIDENKIRNVNIPCFPLIDNKIYEFMSHFHVPTS